MSAHTALDDWIAREARPFTLDSEDNINLAVDRMVAMLGEEVELLGFGEALHGGEEILRLRNRLFQRLVEAHGFCAIAVESSFTRGRLLDDYVNGRGPAAYEEGISHGFGQVEANRELVEWMRAYNADPARAVQLRFYGFDAPTEAHYTSSPREILTFVLDYLEAGAGLRERIEELLGPDADWENPAAMMDPTKSVGLSPNAAALRIEAEDLITELRVRRGELVVVSGADRYAEALRFANLARQLLNYHANVGSTTNPARLDRMLGIRDVIAGDNLMYILERERSRGKVLAFAHNAHLQRGKVIFPWYSFWPAGALLDGMLGPRYAVIGSGVGVSEANGIGEPEAGSLEARLPGPASFIPTHRGQGLAAQEIAGLTTRTGSTRNMSYIPFRPESFADFDGLAFIQSASYTRGAAALP